MDSPKCFTDIVWYVSSHVINDNDYLFFRKSIAFELKETTKLHVIINADEIFPHSENAVGKCPNCGAAVIEKPQGFFCENRVCPFRLWKKNRLLMSGGKPPTRQMIQTLLTDGQVYAKGLKSKTGKTFSATLVMDCAEDGSARIRPVFNQ